MWQNILKTWTLGIVFNPGIPFPGICTKEIIKGLNKDLLIRMLMVASYLIKE